MKPLNTLEIDHLIDNYEFLVGSELQSFMGTTEVITLNLWSGFPVWLTINLSGNKPFFVAFRNKMPVERKFLSKAPAKPFFLFLKTHFVKKKITKVERLEKYGRLIRFHFGEDIYIEFRLFSGGINLIAVNGEKKVSFKKPQDLVESDQNYTPDGMRTEAVISEQAIDFLNLSSAKVKSIRLDKEKAKIAKKKVQEGIAF